MIGNQIQNYLVESLIGEGGMGSVYLASHVNIQGRKAAIKSLHKSLVANPEIRSRFRREPETLAKLKHPNIVTLYDYVEEKDSLFLIMEFIDGIPLSDHVRNISGPIPEQKAIELFVQVLDACSFAHSQGIIHRDIKPSNIMLTQSGEIKMVDFGIAKLVVEDGNPAYTKTGTKIGTVLYMSPEQVKGLPVTEQSDIYSLGVALFEMLTGVPPYDGEQLSEFEIQNMIVHQPLPRGKSIYMGISDGVEKIIDKATAKDLENRYKTCYEFKSDLIHLYNKSMDLTVPKLGYSLSPLAPSNDLEKTLSNGRPIEVNLDDNISVNRGIIGGIKSPIVYVPVLVLLIGLIGFGVFSFVQTQQINEYLEKGFNNFLIGKYEDSRIWYEKAYKLESPEAAYYLGELYFNGAGVKKDYDKGIEYTQFASDGGFCMATWRVGMAYYSGMGVDENKTKGNGLILDALPCLEDLAISGNAEAQANLGSMYFEGVGIAKDPKEGVKWLKKAADQGYTIPIHWLMTIYYYGVTDDANNTITGVDYEKSLEYAKKLEGDRFFSDVSRMLGYMYLFGNGPTKNRDTALYYFERAAAPDTAYEDKVLVGFLHYQDGRYQKAYDYYQVASNKNIPMAIYGIGDLFHIGKPNGKDLEAAFSWYSKAAQEGFAPANYWLGVMRNSGTGTSINKHLARQNFEQVFQQLDDLTFYEDLILDQENIRPMLYNSYGFMLFYGIGGEQNMELGAELFKMAANKGHGRGTYYLAYTYEQGKGNPQDYDKAFKYYKLAIDLGRSKADRSLIGDSYYRLGCIFELSHKKTANNDKLALALCYYKEGMAHDNESSRDAISRLRNKYNFDLDRLCD